MSRPISDEKRASILEAAFGVFGELGYQSTTIKHIAERAGIAPGSIYNYFTDKEDLFRSTVEEGWAQFLSEFKALVESERPLTERLETLITMGFQKLKESLPLLRGMLFEATQMRIFHDSLDEFCRYVVQLIDEGRRLGYFDIPDNGGHWKKLVKVTVNGVLFSVAMTPEGKTDAEIAALKAAVSQFLSVRVRRGGKP